MQKPGAALQGTGCLYGKDCLMLCKGLGAAPQERGVGAAMQ